MLLSALLTSPAAVLSQEPPAIQVPLPDPKTEEEEPLDTSLYLFGDWGGWRSDLAAEGVSFDLQWTQYLQSVVDGGIDSDLEYGGTLQYLFAFDLGTMGLLPRASVRVLAESRYLDSANPDAGTLLPVNVDMAFPITDVVDEDYAIAVTELTYTQFLSEQFGVVVGKLQTLDGDANEFAGGRGRGQFMKADFVFNPVTALTVPYSTLGGGVVVVFTPSLSVNSMVYNTTDSSTTTGFGDIGDGWTWSTEAQAQYRLGELPGGQNVSFIYAADNDFLDFSRSGLPIGAPLVPRDDDTWAVYWSGWQYLYSVDEAPDRINVLDERADLRGIGVFARLGFADDDTNPVDWTASVGVGGRGLIHGRGDDTFGVGFAYTKHESERFLSVLGLSDRAYALEAYYSFALAPGVNLTFDAQFVEPAPRSVDEATVLAGRLNIRF